MPRGKQAPSRAEGAAPRARSGYASNEQRHTAQVLLRVPRETFREWRELAEQRGESVQDWIRAACAAYVRR
jgi:hypothetical protein